MSVENRLSEREVIERLRAAVTAAGGQHAWARANGFTPPYVHDVLRGRRSLATRILDALGVERVEYYRDKRRP